MLFPHDAIIVLVATRPADLKVVHPPQRTARHGWTSTAASLGTYPELEANEKPFDRRMDKPDGAIHTVQYRAMDRYGYHLFHALHSVQEAGLDRHTCGCKSRTLWER